MKFLASLLLLVSLALPAQAAPTVWRPPAGVSGWFPKISPDGARIAMGFGNIKVLERSSNKITAINVAGIGNRAFSGHWMSPTDLTVMVENDAARTVTTYKVTAPDYATFVKLGVGGSENCAGAGHWVTARHGAAAEVIYDGVVLPGAKTSMNCDVDPVSGMLAHTIRRGPIGTFIEEDWGIRVYDSSRKLLREMKPPKGAANVIRIGADGYVGYGYYGVSHMLTPTGAYVDVTVTPNKAEGPGKAFKHKGVVWVATSGDGGIYLRPIGEKAAIIVPIASVRVEAVSVGDTFVVAGNSDKGALGVSVVLDTEPRVVPTAPTPPAPAPKPPVVTPPVVTPPVTPAPPAVDCGGFSGAEKEVLKRIGAMFPDLRKSADDDGRRQFNEKLAQQLDFSFPDKNWGMKKASKTRPISKDSVARVISGALCGWDTVNGSTREMNLNADGEVLDPEQVYVDVTATNHLGGVVEPPPPPPPADCAAVKAQLAAVTSERDQARGRVGELERERDELKAQRDALLVEVDALKQRIAVLENAPPPSCRAKVPGWLSGLGVKVGCEIIK